MATHILIVDDSRLIRKVVKKVAGQVGFNPDDCAEAANGREALDYIARHPVDLVLSDINMPVMDGLEFLRQLRALPDKKDLSVIMVSTEGSEETMRRAMESGATGYVLKPFTAELLVEQLRPLGLLPTGGPVQPPSDIDLSNPTSF